MTTVKQLSRALLGTGFILAGINHFVMPNFYRAIIPPYLPNPEALVDISGYAEIGLGGLALLPHSRAQWLSRYGLIALLVAIFPANLHMALNPERFPQIPEAVLWWRLPFQLLFIAGTYWATEPSDTVKVRFSGSD